MKSSSRSSQRCDALVVHCMDYRLQKFLRPWIARRFGVDNYDLIAIPGAVLDSARVIKYVKLVERIHKIKRVCLVNHEDCRAYGPAGNPVRHATDLRATRRKIRKQFPKLQVETFYLQLNGKFKLID